MYHVLTGTSAGMTKIELLQKFIDNQCTAEEAQLAMHYLQEDPALWDSLLDKTDWDRIDDNKPLHPDVEESLRKHILSKTIQRPAVILKRTLAVAASVAALIFLASLLFYQTTPLPTVPQSAAHQSAPDKRITNNTLQVQHITLPDHSAITLYPGGSIEYPVDFASNRRVQLRGKAVFDVARDRLHPFTVYSGKIATTAIGTRFLVDHRRGNLRVQLYEGKVVVKPVDSTSSIKDTYLLPGQECFINHRTDQLVVQLILPKTKVIAKKADEKPASEIETTVNAVALQFEKVPLEDVLAALENIYPTRIEFNPADMEGAYFTGRFQPGDSPEAILKLITVMNSLKAVEADGVVKILKDAKVEKEDKQREMPNLFSVPESSRLAHTFKNKKLPVTTHHNQLLNDIPYVAPPVQECIVEQEGIVFFKNTTLKNIVKTISRLSGYEISYDENELSAKYFTGQVPANRASINMLGIICRMNGLKLQKEGIKYKIQKL